MKNQLPIIAIVGQPNAGKSSLLNKIAGRPLAVTSDLSGTTRDRQYADTVWAGVNFTLVDTAGLTQNSKDQLELSVLKQIEVALVEADAVIFVVDGKENPGAVPQAILQKFRKIKKPLLLAVNKLDSPKTREERLVAFRRLGLKPLFAVSAINGRGIGDMLDAIVALLPTQKSTGDDVTELPADQPIAVSIVGKPNVGKSSVFNQLLKEERVVVSPTPGTTRTAIDSQIKIKNIDYTFIDTAGLKKKEYRQAQADVFSGFQTFKSIRRSDVCFFCLDANEEITKQDQTVANEIFNMQKGCVILANKVDLLPASKKGGISRSGSARGGGKQTANDYQALRDAISMHFPFLWSCPLFFVSGLTGQNLEEALSAVKPIFERRQKMINGQTLQEFLNKKMKQNPPKLMRDQKKPKVFGLTQIGINPPTFDLQVNHASAISQQFRKFVENAIIKELDFWGTPIILRLQGKDKT